MTLVPVTTFGRLELKEFAEEPILLNVALSRWSSTTKLAAQTTKWIDHDMGEANHISVFHWRPNKGDKGWELFRPPNSRSTLRKASLQDFGLRIMT